MKIKNNNIEIRSIDEDIIKQDKQSQVNYLFTLFDKFIITRNELRKQLGYITVEGADETKLKISISKIGQNKGVEPTNKGKHRVYDNFELKIYHYE